MFLKGEKVNSKIEAEKKKLAELQSARSGYIRKVREIETEIVRTTGRISAFEEMETEEPLVELPLSREEELDEARARG